MSNHRIVRVGLAFVAMFAFSACGGTPGAIGDGGLDGTLSDAKLDGRAGKDGSKDGSGGKDGSGSKDGSGIKDGGACANLGAACKTAGDCCSDVCTGGICSFPSCTSDGKACTTDAQCCGGTCDPTAKTCTPLNTTCETLGNSCKTGTDCCSSRCAGGVCEPSSYCGQNGDVCMSGADCCGGVCNEKSGATVGTCGQPPGGASNCTAVDGTVCGGVTGDGGVILDEAGLPSCGGSCCSRLCAPYAPTGVLICQPATGCHVVGDLCASDKDCCGSKGLPGEPKKPVTCDITPPNTLGVCRNPIGCKPNGDVCKLATASCNASCDCCAGNCETMDTCKQDSTGVPRCANLNCGDAGASCATSADCCDGTPCVPDPAYVDGGTAPPFICYDKPCVSCGACTTNADCCPGQTCAIKSGHTSGICGPCKYPDAGAPEGGKIPEGGVPVDSGMHCAVYGQDCKTSSDCCSGVPCSFGSLACAPGDVGCTCHNRAVP